MPTSPSFHDVLFPLRISFRAALSTERQTEVIALGSGFEERNTRWAHSRRSYDAGQGVRTIDDLHEILAFFEERRGQLYAFKWRDRVDNRSCLPSKIPQMGDETIGIGDGATTAFQLVKTYGSAHAPYQRLIQKPRAETLKLAVDGTALEAGSEFTLDDQTGLVTLFGPPPAQGALITAGFEYDVPVRFQTDRLDINLTRFDAGDIPTIPLVEVRL